MATDYQRLFGVRSLNEKVEAFGQDAVRNFAATRKFNMGRKLMAEDGTCEWDEIQFSRGLAPVTGIKGKHVEKAELTKIVRRSAVMAIKRSVRLDPHKIHYERAPGELRPNARAYVENELRDLVNEIAATIEYAAMESLRGTLTVNSTNIPGSSQSFAISYSPNTYASSASWALAGTQILSSEIPALKTDIEQLSGLVPAQCLCGNTVEGYMVGNSQVSNFAAQALGERFITQSGTMRGPMLGGLQIGGLSWEITEGGYIPEGGSFTRYMPDTDEVIVLPSDGELRDVLGMALGRGLVPAQQYGPAAAAAELIVPAGEGFYSYAALDPDGPFIKLYAGWIGLPIPIRPQGVCVADVVS